MIDEHSQLPPSPANSAIGDLVQPARQCVALADGTSLACQSQESGLKSVFGILLVVQQPLTQGQHHRPMAPEQQFKRRFVPGPREPLQQHGVRHGARTGSGHALQMTQQETQ
jgi:hypothetical protein